jgi:NAD(P)-dependent dehydrogenase (short-subunit alcohol dehydrogenase family)
MDLGLDDAAAVVVGGSRGMGLETARALAGDGARVALVGRSRGALDTATEDLDRRGSPDTIGLVADTRDRAQVEAAFEEVGQRWGGELNILVNAVGTPVVGPVDNLTDDQWHAAVDDIALGMVRCVRAALPLLRQAGWARIVNFAAQSTQRQHPMLPAYTAAKTMVVSISKNLSLRLAADDILVNVVSPGTVATDSLVGWANSIGLEPGDLRGLMDAVTQTVGHAASLRRVGDPTEVGVVAAFLASQRNSYMTGANVNVDGGSDFV